VTTIVDRDGPSRARSVRDVVLNGAAAAEELRTLTPELVDALWDSGLMQFLNPAEAGGEEPGFREMIDTWQEMAWQDGSFGWIGIANLPSSAAAAAYLPDEGFAEVFTANANRVTLGGQFFPNGQGIEVEGGWQVSGAWNFGSGTGHAEYVVGGFFPMRDGEMLWEPNGMPVMMAGVFPRDEVTFTDGWHVQGLKGTGSYDYNLTDVFLPEYRAFSLFTREPHRGSAPTYRMGLMAITAAGHAAWALGVAKSMLDDVQELALSKVRMGQLETHAHRTTFQRDFAHHLGMWRAARLLVVESFEAAEAAMASCEPITPTMRADLRIAATYATEASRDVAQWAHLAAGTSAIREGNRLERAFRDLYTGTQHAFISEKVYTDSAQVLLGLVDDQPGL
jgi:alkylation response protein AidB-like acyl-CoA dehydrogenase